MPPPPPKSKGPPPRKTLSVEDFQKAFSLAPVPNPENPEKLYLPRWKDGPSICIKENLPAFKDKSEVKKFYEKLPRLSAMEEWTCDFCGMIHLLSNYTGKNK